MTDTIYVFEKPSGMLEYCGDIDSMTTFIIDCIEFMKAHKKKIYHHDKIIIMLDERIAREFSILFGMRYEEVPIMR